MSLFTTNSGKSVLRPEQVAALVVQPLIDKAVATQVATTVQITSHDLRIPVVQGDPTAAWVPEGTEIPASDSELAEVRITPAGLKALSVISNELADDSSPAALQVVGDGLVRDLTRRVDEAFFGNPGSAEAPAGLDALAGVTEVLISDTTVTAGVPLVDGASGTSMDWAILAKSFAEVHNTAVTAFVTSPGRAAWLEFQKESEISNRSLLQPDPTSPTGRRIAGVPLYTTPACDDDTVWCLPKAHTFVAIRQGATVEADRSAYFSSDQTALRAVMRIGYGFSYPAAVVKVRFDRPLLSTPPKK
jgi:HK97 family phage major capsid protein